MCCVWTFAERVTEQEKQMPLEKYQIPERRPVAVRLVDYTLTAWLFCTSCFGMVVGALWGLGHLKMCML